MIARLLFCFLFVCIQASLAFPPTPPTTFHGKIRGEFGYVLTDGKTELLLLADGKEVARTRVSDSGAFGDNYQLTLPLDLDPANGVYRIAAVTPDPAVVYSFAAERDGVRLPVTEMEAGKSDSTPESGEIKQINFTLGEDLDGDGLPDAWEKHQASLLKDFEGDALDLFSAEGDRDSDGLSDHDEYIAGTFALLFEDGLNFDVVEVLENRSAELRFLAVDGKSYRIESSADFKNWKPVEFAFPTKPDATVSIYHADDTRERTVHTVPTEESNLFYRLRVD